MFDATRMDKPLSGLRRRYILYIFVYLLINGRIHYEGMCGQSVS